MSTQRVALVTGAASGLGLAIAKYLGELGVVVVGADLDASIITKMDELPATWAAHQGLVLNVCDQEAIAAAIQGIDQSLGRLDILVNCAGIGVAGANGPPGIDEISAESWQKVLQTNLTGPFLLCQAALPLMRRHEWGRIVNIASRAGRTAIAASEVAYASSKAGLIGLTRKLALEVAAEGITVNAIAPGLFYTPMLHSVDEEMLAAFQKSIPVGRSGDPVELAATVAFLASREAGYITGATLDMNGGSFIGA